MPVEMISRALALTWVVAVLSIAGNARADQVDVCVDAADRAQQLRDPGKLIEAREQLLVCSVSSCPSAVAKQCVRWLHEVDEEIPTLSLRVRAGLVDVTDVEVLVDGQTRLTELDGRPMPINPGMHHLTFRRGKGVAIVEESLAARAGEKNRLVDVQLEPVRTVAVVSPNPTVVMPVEPLRQHRGFRFPWASGLLLGISVAGFGATIPLVVVAGDDASHLRGTCAPQCTGSQVDDVHTKLIVANVTFGVGIAGLAASVFALVVANVGHRRDTVVSFAVWPASRGAAVSAVGVF